jgi:futalosine hydrolase
MPLRILLVAATTEEAGTLKKITGLINTAEGFAYRCNEIIPLVTGVGSIATAWALTKCISAGLKPDLAINIGIAGSFRDDLMTGEVVVPVSDCFADAGVDTGKNFLTLAEAGLEDPDRFPFRGGRIFAENRFVARAIEVLKPVKAVTVNTATGSPAVIERLMKKYQPDIETMEGATFFYICSGGKIPFLALRSVSNKVEPRNKARWNIPLALDNLSEKLEKVLLLFD